MGETLLLATAAYVATNLDDLLLNMLLFAQAKSKQEERALWLGKYVGLGGLLLLSVAAGWGLRQLSGLWLRAFALLPLTLGGKELYRLYRQNRRNRQGKQAETAEDEPLSLSADGSHGGGKGWEPPWQ